MYDCAEKNKTSIYYCKNTDKELITLQNKTDTSFNDQSVRKEQNSTTVF